MEINHNKIITKAAREVLKPQGLFQRGTSRVWIDDNGWFLIMVEFQPSSWDKGTFLNVGINFLWKREDYMSFNYGYRESKFVKFDGDETVFYSEMVKLAELALERVEEYRGFKNLHYAKECILERSNNEKSLSHKIYEKMLICGLKKDTQAKEFYDKLIDVVKDSQLCYEQEYYTELTEKIAPILEDADLFYEYIISKIKEQRAFLMSKSSMKKMNSEFVM